MSGLAVAATTLLVMIAFATNSVLARAALKPGGDEKLIDPATYTTVRIITGAAVLLAIQTFRVRRAGTDPRGGSSTGTGRWLSACMLTLYAAAFSFAYVRLDTASGTLILFGFVQLTMIAVAASRGEVPRRIELAGMLVASLGLTWLVLPSLTQFSIATESVLMMLSGIGWGFYSVLGKGSRDPIADTAGNFLRGVPLAGAVSLVCWSNASATHSGFWLAAASGGLTSGIGYVLWYTVLPHLRSAQAAVVQLSVPVIAAIGGVLFAGDPITQRTVLAGALILGGIGLTIRWRATAVVAKPD